jgi:hypothetical protein
MNAITYRLAPIVLVFLVAACSAGGATPPGATTPPGPSSPPPTAVPVTTAAEAAARVEELVPSLAGIGPQDPNMIGGCCFWQATQTAAGFTVVFEVGWGDCQAGCINRHRYTYAVSRDGAVQLTGDTGEPVPSGVPGAGGGEVTTGGGGGFLPGGSGIQGRALGGPTCPVVAPGDPNCGDRPIAGATVLVLDAHGTEIARLITDGDGRYAVVLPAGPYTVEPQPVEGYMRQAEPIAVTVGDGVTTVDLSYDTGIR